MAKGKISVLLCEDMDEFAEAFFDNQRKYFDVEVFKDVHGLPAHLRNLEIQDKLPDILLLDLFSKREEICEDDEFKNKRIEVDGEIKIICEMLNEIGQKARNILSAHGIDYLKIIREQHPEYKLPVILYSRLGPYILQPEEAAAVDEYHSEFLLKWIGHDEQRKKIERFFKKWRSQDQPIALEISRKISTLPPSLANAVTVELKKGRFKAAITSGYLVVEEFLKEKLKCTKDGKGLSKHMEKYFLEHGKLRDEEELWEFQNRVKAVSGLYYSAYILIRCCHMHGLKVARDKNNSWREVDMCLSIYSLLWIEVEDLLS